MTEIEDSLRALKSKIDSLTQARDKAEARAEIAQSDAKDGMKRLLDEYGVKTLEEADAEIERRKAAVGKALQDLLAEVEELESE